MPRRSLAAMLALPLVLSLELVLPASAQGWTTTGGETLPAPSGADFADGSGDPEQELAALLAGHARADGPGVALAVWLDGEPLFTGARGLADLERAVPCTSETVFDLASLAKSVTGAAVMRLVADGKLRLDAGVRTLLPELSETFAPVQVQHLLHHTAGIEDVDGLMALAGWRSGEAVAFEDALRVVSGLRHLRFAPGSQHMYSNGGYVLLAEIVRRVSGTPLPELAATTFFAPLQMQGARLHARPGALVPRAAVPTSGAEGARRQHALDTCYGPGAFLGSVLDLARWGDELRTGAKLGRAFVERLRVGGTLADGSALDYGAGLARLAVAGHPAFGHSGSVPGGQSTLAFFPDSGLVIAAATNDGDGPPLHALLEQVALRLLGAGEAPAERAGPKMNFIPSSQAAPAASLGVAVDPERLRSYAGVYRMSEGPDLAVASDGTRLLIGFGMAPDIEVFPLPSGRFLLPPVNYEFSFEPEHERATLHVTEASQRRSPPRDIRGTRWRPEPLDEKARAALAGTYRSDEVGSHYEIVFEDGQPWLVHARHGRMPLTPFAPDVYTLPGTALRKLVFVREKGRVTGFELEAFSWSARASFRRL